MVVIGVCQDAADPAWPRRARRVALLQRQTVRADQAAVRVVEAMCGGQDQFVLDKGGGAEPFVHDVEPADPFPSTAVVRGFAG